MLDFWNYFQKIILEGNPPWNNFIKVGGIIYIYTNTYYIIICMYMIVYVYTVPFFSFVATLDPERDIWFWCHLAANWSNCHRPCCMTQFNWLAKPDKAIHFTASWHEPILPLERVGTSNMKMKQTPLLHPAALTHASLHYNSSHSRCRASCKVDLLRSNTANCKEPDVEVKMLGQVT